MCIALLCPVPMSHPDHPARARFFFGSFTPCRSSRASRASRSRRMISDSGVASCSDSARYRACCLGVMSTTNLRLATSSFRGSRGIFQPFHRVALHMQQQHAWRCCRTGHHQLRPMTHFGIAQSVSVWLTAGVSWGGDCGGNEKRSGAGELKRVHSAADADGKRHWLDGLKRGALSGRCASWREYRNGTTGRDGR